MNFTELKALIETLTTRENFGNKYHWDIKESDFTAEQRDELNNEWFMPSAGIYEKKVKGILFVIDVIDDE